MIWKMVHECIKIRKNRNLWNSVYFTKVSILTCIIIEVSYERGYVISFHLAELVPVVWDGARGWGGLSWISAFWLMSILGLWRAITMLALFTLCVNWCASECFAVVVLKLLANWLSIVPGSYDPIVECFQSLASFAKIGRVMIYSSAD